MQSATSKATSIAVASTLGLWPSTSAGVQTSYGYETEDGNKIFYRETGNPENPDIILLHGFPSSSYQYHNLIDDLSVSFYLIAPDYQNNVAKYPEWQVDLKEHQPTALIVLAANDAYFPTPGAEVYEHDPKDVDYNILDTGHFALEEDGMLIAGNIQDFYSARDIKLSRSNQAGVTAAPADHTL